MSRSARSSVEYLCMLGFLLVRRHSIFENQIPSRSSSPAHQRSIIRTMLERTTVKDILALRPRSQPVPVSERTSLSVLIERFAASDNTCLPVVSETGGLTGTLSVLAVQRALGRRPSTHETISARELATPAITVTEEQSLHAALSKMSQFDCEDLLVVNGSEPPTVIAVLTSGDINAIYDEQLLNPPPAETVSQSLRKKLAGWLPPRWAKTINRDSQNAS